MWRPSARLDSLRFRDTILVPLGSRTGRRVTRQASESSDKLIGSSMRLKRRWFAMSGMSSAPAESFSELDPDNAHRSRPDEAFAGQG